MRIVVYSHPSLKHQRIRGEAFVAGVRRHGYDDVAHLSTDHVDEKADLAVFWGMHRAKRQREYQIDQGRDYLVMERSYVGDRFHWTSLGYNGLNGHADFLNENSPPDRWNELFSSYLKPWKERVHPKVDYVLLSGQVKGDASIVHLNVDYKNVYRELRKATSRRVYYRPHPQRPWDVGIPMIPVGEIEDGSLESQLAKASCLVTMNSNTSVDAILNGIPAITLADGSMAHDVTRHTVQAVEERWMPDRTRWCNDLAYTQWSPEEIENGDAWNHLKRKYE